MPVGVVGSACRGEFGAERDNPLLASNASHAADVVLTLGCRFEVNAANLVCQHFQVFIPVLLNVVFIF